MISRELSNAAFRFSLRQPGAEIMGGGVQTPPPSRRWKIQRPSRARVKRRNYGLQKFAYLETSVCNIVRFYPRNKAQVYTVPDYEIRAARPTS